MERVFGVQWTLPFKFVLDSGPTQMVNGEPPTMAGAGFKSPFSSGSPHPKSDGSNDFYRSGQRRATGRLFGPEREQESRVYPPTIMELMGGCWETTFLLGKVVHLHDWREGFSRWMYGFDF